jgi:Cu/Ag efflux protein CusF
MQANQKLPITIIAIISLAAGFAAGGCRSQRVNEPVVRRYELKGRVESIDFDKKRVTIAHEDIKGYMDAMTMGFAVKDESVLRELKSGDRLQATLVYDSSTNLSWLEEIKVTRN